MSAVRVQLGERSYTIEIGTGNLSTLGQLASDWCEVSHAVVVTDQNVEAPMRNRRPKAWSNPAPTSTCW